MTTASTSRVPLLEPISWSPCPTTRRWGSVALQGRLALLMTDGAGLDGLDDLLEPALAAREHEEGEEPVGLAGVAPEVDRYVGLAEAAGVGLPLVAQDVVLGGDDDGGRQALEALGPQGRGVGVGARRDVG